MSKSPAFQLYAADFYMDTNSWTATEVGVYFRLLMHEWVNGSIPNDEKKMARIAGIDPGNFKKCYVLEVSKKFSPNADGNLINQRLEIVRKEQEEYRKIQSELGLRSAKARKERGIFPFNKSNDGSNQGSNHTSNQNQTLLPSSSSSVKDKDLYIPYEEIISYLNKKSGKSFSPKTSSHRTLIKNRWKLFPDVSFFLKVIDNKTAAWGHDPEMTKFLRPETLFGSKFDSYLNENGTPKPKTLREIVQGFEKENKTLKQIVSEEGL